MAKKKELDVVLEELGLNHTDTPDKEQISLVDFADLNTLKDKLNEVITYINR